MAETKGWNEQSTANRNRTEPGQKICLKKVAAKNKRLDHEHELVQGKEEKNSAEVK